MNYRYQVAFYSGVPHVKVFQPRHSSDFDLDGNTIGGMSFNDAKQIVIDWHREALGRAEAVTEEDLHRGEI